MISEGKIILVKKRQATLRIVAVAFMLMMASYAFALGLGEIKVRSSLGQSLLAHSEVLGNEAESLNPSCLRARLVSIDGVFLASVNVAVYQRQSKRAISFTTKQAINEPAVTLIVDVNCETQLHREFSILLDPPEATHTASLQVRDESPFAGVATETVKPAVLPASTADQVKSTGMNKQTPVRKHKKEGDDSAAFVQTNPAPVKAKSVQKTVKPARDVLKLSDEVILPPAQNGLRMSDILSTDAGRQLLQNDAELRAAQARMAAILRDENPSAPETVSKPNDLAEIASLKRETELLRKQSVIDKSALDDLQNKSQFDLWLMLLAAVAVVAILVIVFLLYYIRKNVGGSRSTWWEGEPESALDLEIIDTLAPELTAEVESKSNSSLKTGGKTNAEKLATPQADPAFLNTGSDGNSGFYRTPTLEETNSSIFNFFSPRGSSVKVEEISDVTQEAEFWISMNDPLRAIEILQAQERIEQPDSPVPWLFLLDLYRTVNDGEKYNQLRDRFIVQFNANIPEFDVDVSLLSLRSLEDFEHLVARICNLWESHEIIPYLESLLVDDRQGKRAGFDLPVYRDILMLLGIAHELERMRSLDAEMQDMLVSTRRAESKVEKVDPVTEAEFGTIEFETIDFPAIDLASIKKKP